MKISIATFALFLMFISCKSPEAKEVVDIRTVADQIEKELAPDNTIVEATATGFLDKYPVINLPIIYKWNDTEQGKILMSKAFDAEDQSKICNSKLKCVESEQLFYVGKYELENESIALLTFIVGDFTERLVLSIHSKDEKIISSETLNMMSEELDYGYSSYISKSFRIYRSKMFYKTGTVVAEVDSEEEFWVTSDGMIEQLK